MKPYLLVLTLLLTGEVFAQNVGINNNGTAPNSNAILDLDVSGLASNNKKGELIPRMTTVDRDATWPILSGIPEGLKIYNLTKHCEEYFNGTNWVGDCNCPENSCPVGMTDIGGVFKIEQNTHSPAKFFPAADTCQALGLELPTSTQWYVACQSGLVPSLGSNDEWLDDSPQENNFLIGGSGGWCDGTSNQFNETPHVFRCVCKR